MEAKTMIRDLVRTHPVIETRAGLLQHLKHAPMRDMGNYCRCFRCGAGDVVEKMYYEIKSAKGKA